MRKALVATIGCITVLLAVVPAASADSVCPAGPGGPCVFTSSTHSGGNQDCSHATTPYAETHGVAATTGNTIVASVAGRHDVGVGYWCFRSSGTSSQFLWASARVTGGVVQDTYSSAYWGSWGLPCDTRVKLDNNARNIHQHHSLGCPAGSPPALPVAVP